jgi:hypothetical protein
MLKGTTFSGQPVFAQLTGVINRSTFATLVKEYDADRYCKRCKSLASLPAVQWRMINLKKMSNARHKQTYENLEAVWFPDKARQIAPGHALCLV